MASFGDGIFLSKIFFVNQHTLKRIDFFSLQKWRVIMSTASQAFAFSSDDELVLSLTPSEKKVLHLILDGNRRFEGKYYQSKAGIAKLLKISERTVYRAIDRLLEMGLIFEKWFENVVIRQPKESLMESFCHENVRKEKKVPLKKRNDNDGQASDNVPSQSFSMISSNVFHDVVLSKKDLRVLCCLTKKNQEAMKSAIDDYQTFRCKESVRNPVAYVISKWKYYNIPRSEGIVDEVKPLPISQADKAILSSYSAKNRNAFLLAYEDFKSYSMLRWVGNAAAFITSRFSEYVKGEGGAQKVDAGRNKQLAEWIETKAIVPKGVSLGAYSQGIEFAAGQACDVILYSDRKFDEKVKRLMKKRGINLKF